MKKTKRKLPKEIQAYDQYDTTSFINPEKPLKLKELGLKLPQEAPSTVISIRLPKYLLNGIRAFSSEHDLPYQSVIKFFLQEQLKKHR